MTDDDKLDDLERYYIDQLRMLQRSYEEAAKPIISRLMEIRSIRMPPMFVTTDEAEIILKAQASKDD